MRKVMKDTSTAAPQVSEADVRQKLTELRATACEQVTAEQCSFQRRSSKIPCCITG